MGAVETLIVWENLDVQRITLKVPNSDSKSRECVCGVMSSSSREVYV